MEKIQQWSDHIIVHFWHCASICKASETTSDDEALDKMKVQEESFLDLIFHRLAFKTCHCSKRNISITTTHVITFRKKNFVCSLKIGGILQITCFKFCLT